MAALYATALILVVLFVAGLLGSFGVTVGIVTAVQAFRRML